MDECCLPVLLLSVQNGLLLLVGFGFHHHLILSDEEVGPTPSGAL
jgi:hypothetical protein